MVFGSQNEKIALTADVVGILGPPEFILIDPAIALVPMEDFTAACDKRRLQILEASIGVVHASSSFRGNRPTVWFQIGRKQVKR